MYTEPAGFSTDPKITSDPLAAAMMLNGRVDSLSPPPATESRPSNSACSL